MLYPQNGDRIVTIDSATLLHPVHTVAFYSGMLHSTDCQGIICRACDQFILSGDEKSKLLSLYQQLY